MYDDFTPRNYLCQLNHYISCLWLMEIFEWWCASLCRGKIILYILFLRFQKKHVVCLEGTCRFHWVHCLSNSNVISHLNIGREVDGCLLMLLFNIDLV